MAVDAPMDENVEAAEAFVRISSVVERFDLEIELFVGVPEGLATKGMTSPALSVVELVIAEIFVSAYPKRQASPKSIGINSFFIIPP